MINIVIEEDDGRLKNIGQYCPKQKYIIITKKKSKHFFRKLNAWGIDAEVFKKYRGLGLETIILHEEESNKFYVAIARDMEYYGTFLQFRQHRKQLFLPEQYWKESN